MRVLLVDDEPEFLATLSKRLGRRSVEAQTAFSGEEALTVLAAEAAGFDAVVLDVRMPGLGGLGTLARMRVEFPGIPVILLTAHADVNDAMAGLEAGAFCHLVKPVDLNTLIWRLQDAQKEHLLRLEQDKRAGRDIGTKGA